MRVRAQLCEFYGFTRDEYDDLTIQQINDYSEWMQNPTGPSDADPTQSIGPAG